MLSASARFRLKKHLRFHRAVLPSFARVESAINVSFDAELLNQDGYSYGLYGNNDVPGLLRRRDLFSVNSVAQYGNNNENIYPRVHSIPNHLISYDMHLIFWNQLDIAESNGYCRIKLIMWNEIVIVEST